MKWQAFLVGAILVILVLFAAVNWDAFAASDELNLVVRRTEAPLGIVLLAVILILSALYLAFVAGARTTQLVETRRFAKEAQEARQLADQAELSRYSELRSVLETELDSLRAAVKEEGQAAREHLAASEEGLRAALDESHNILVANLGEMDTRMGGSSDSFAGDDTGT
jgi:uncharacterized integral membrane protein